MMKIRSFALICAWMVLAQTFAASKAGAQVLVYRLEILKEHGINYHPFEGGFFAAPLLGGAGSFLLTSTDGARTFTQSDTSGRLFTAVDGDEKKAVISATTGSGTAHGAMVATGPIDHQLTVNGPTVNLNIRVANSLSGAAVSADDESTASAPATDGSIGSAGVSQIRFVLDEPQTKHANNHGLSLAQTVADLALELQRQGFNKETPTPTPTTGTGGTTTGSTTTSGTTSGS